MSTPKPLNQAQRVLRAHDLLKEVAIASIQVNGYVPDKIADGLKALRPEANRREMPAKRALRLSLQPEVELALKRKAQAMGMLPQDRAVALLTAAVDDIALSADDYIGIAESVRDAAKRRA